MSPTAPGPTLGADCPLTGPTRWRPWYESMSGGRRSQSLGLARANRRPGVSPKRSTRGSYPRAAGRATDLPPHLLRHLIVFILLQPLVFLPPALRGQVGVHVGDGVVDLRAEVRPRLHGADLA